MGIFDVFTGASAKDAAAQNAALASDNAAKNNALYGDYQNKGLGYLANGLTNSTGAQQGAISAYAPLSALGTKYGGATTMLENALGANGAGGTAAATDAFHAGPGYTFARDQALDAINRAGAANGFSGNTMADAGKYAAGYADQNYNNWLTNLGGFINPEVAATGGAANGTAAGYTGLAGLYGQNADAQTNVVGNATSGIANSNNTNTQAQIQSNSNAANAQMSASGNFWNGLMSLGGSLAKGYWGGAK